ncbi:hypothetical protein BDA99DRAFT_520932 [Phascolomyces articulosus]|uniref:Uncharacterized protein n=1 Tax=Phascolomyces articulosus TaxID=60185 RepID=A0AAD5JSJ5_9FUNG|nr:hypothetical protein BDA99DRAFT_520932 [Phascolomyces articulosus]
MTYSSSFLSTKRFLLLLFSRKNNSLDDVFLDPIYFCLYLEKRNMYYIYNVMVWLSIHFFLKKKRVTYLQVLSCRMTVSRLL